MLSNKYMYFTENHKAIKFYRNLTIEFYNYEVHIYTNKDIVYITKELDYYTYYNQLTKTQKDSVKKLIDLYIYKEDNVVYFDIIKFYNKFKNSLIYEDR